MARSTTLLFFKFSDRCVSRTLYVELKPIFKTRIASLNLEWSKLAMPRTYLLDEESLGNTLKSNFLIKSNLI